MKVTLEGNTLEFSAETNAERDLLAAITMTIAGGGFITAEPNECNHERLKFNGDAGHLKRSKQRTSKKNLSTRGVWERPGEVGPNNCYPDPSDFD